MTTPASRAARRAHGKRKRADGLCNVCTRPRVTLWYCAVHRDKLREYARQRRALAGRVAP